MTAQAATANPKAATTGFTARTGETSQVTTSYYDTENHASIGGATEAIPVGTSMAIPAFTVNTVNGKQGVFKLMSYMLDGTTYDIDPITGATVTIPNEAATTLQLNVVVNPLAYQKIIYQQQHATNTTGATIAYATAADQTPNTVNPTAGYDTTSRKTVT